MPGDVTLIGAVDTVHGAAVTIHQDHDGVKILAGGTEFMFTREAARTLASLMIDAAVDSVLWELYSA